MQDIYALLADLPDWAKTDLATVFDPTTITFKSSIVKPLDAAQVNVNCTTRKLSSFCFYEREWNACELVTAEIGSVVVSVVMLFASDGTGDCAGSMVFVIDEACKVYQVAQDADADMYARWWAQMTSQSA